MEINKFQTLEICKIAWKAGEKILDIYSRKFKIFRKKRFFTGNNCRFRVRKNNNKRFKKDF